MEKYRLYRVDADGFVDKDYTKWQIVAVLFNNTPFSRHMYLNDKKADAECIKNVIRYLSFNDNDKFVIYYTTDFEHLSENRLSMSTVKNYDPKTYRVYDEWDRIVPPDEIRRWLTTFDEKKYNPPKRERKTYTNPVEFLPYPGNGRRRSWKDHRG